MLNGIGEKKNGIAQKEIDGHSSWVAQSAVSKNIQKTIVWH